MITLYHYPQTRSSRFIFLLEELGAPYEIHQVSTLTDGADPANPHPHGKVPAIRDNETGDVVYESPAITLYLTDKFPKAGLGPTVGGKGRGAYLSWLVYYGSVLEPAFMSKFVNMPVPRPQAGWVEVEAAMQYVIETLSKGPYLLGDAFSAADILYGTTFAMFGKSPMMPKSEVIDGYVKRVTERPALARAQAKDGTR
ncbi:MAG TPA: glutathione S-transferase family protein [Rhizomicrobium sp.]|jgi:glutathione S-transferase|nr:glutathione S-transferase family protein [Rhizomicrobium sp.]